MLVTIVGPNLPDQSKGTFHVHKSECHDLRKLRGYTMDMIDAVSKLDVAEWIYPPGDFEWTGSLSDAGPYLDDIWFAPCVMLELV